MTEDIIEKGSHGIVCNFCGENLSQESNYCWNCGNDLKRHKVLSDFEVGKISALRDMRADVFKAFSAVGLIISVLAVFGISESVHYRVSTSVSSDLDEALREANARIEKEESASLSLIRDNQIEVAKELGALEAKSQTRITEMDRLISDGEAAALRLANASKAGEKALADLEAVVSAVSATTTLGDIVESFYSIRDIDVLSHIIFDPEKLGVTSWDTLAQELGSERFFFQVNLNTEKENLIQFRSSGDEPIKLGDDTVAHKNIMYAPHFDIAGKPISYLDRLDHVAFKFFANSKGSRKIDNREYLSAISGVRFFVRINGVPTTGYEHMFTDSEKQEIGALSESGEYLITWKSSENHEGFEEIYLKKLRSANVTSTPVKEISSDAD
ncbi:hypothetical protein [uncultured Roseobacter sp.]|uniref:hypothetical protein n=1 Tax=uncultured Roseobacter sp. TaxID=114847 RepID=UPI002624B8B2|nr:hypothetical protein [uncultured Roseobacter sp.]